MIARRLVHSALGKLTTNRVQDIRKKIVVLVHIQVDFCTTGEVFERLHRALVTFRDGSVEGFIESRPFPVTVTNIILTNYLLERITAALPSTGLERSKIL